VDYRWRVKNNNWYQGRMQGVVGINHPFELDILQKLYYLHKHY